MHVCVCVCACVCVRVCLYVRLCVHLLGGCPALHDIWVFLHQGVTLKLAQAADVAIQGFQQVLLSPLHL